jgi:hypothetical protein
MMNELEYYKEFIMKHILGRADCVARLYFRM